MRKKDNNTGFAIALAWPETLCKRAGAWYDAAMHHLGISSDGYYRVGHAAVVLADDDSGYCRYYDFGRYHAPYGHGRVRSAETDLDLTVTTRADIKGRPPAIANLDEILSELYRNPSTHGTGAIYATAARINFREAMTFTKHLQEKDFIAYGPFIPYGTNCSRFVRSVILAGKPAIAQRMALMFSLTVSPTPLWNVRAVGGRIAGIGLPYNEKESILEVV